MNSIISYYNKKKESLIILAFSLSFIVSSPGFSLITLIISGGVGLGEVQRILTERSRRQGINENEKENQVSRKAYRQICLFLGCTRLKEFERTRSLLVEYG